MQDGLLPEEAVVDEQACLLLCIFRKQRGVDVRDIRRYNLVVIGDVEICVCGSKDGKNRLGS